MNPYLWEKTEVECSYTSVWHTLVLQLFCSGLATILMHLSFPSSYSSSITLFHVTMACIKASQYLSTTLGQASTNRHCMLPVLLYAYSVSNSYLLFTSAIVFQLHFESRSLQHLVILDNLTG